MLNHAIQTDVRRRTVKTPVQKRILEVLSELADESGEIHRSLREIAARAQACRKTVIRVLHELEELGEICILSPQRIRGHYRINNLPGDEKPRIDSLRMPIVQAIRLLPLPVRVSVIFQALAKYASRQGNNIFPSVKTLVRDTGYCKPIIQETLRWLLRTDFIRPDRDCINPNYQARVGYLIPSWNANAQLLLISEEQIEQIKVLYRHHNRHYWEKRGESEGGQAQDDSTWLEDHSLDLDDDQQDDPELWFEEEESEGEEELAEEESVPPAAPVEEPLPIPQKILFQESGEEVSSTPSDMFRAVLRSQRAAATISLKQYHTAVEAIQPHLDIITAHESGTPVDEAMLKKSLMIIRFYQRTIDAYEQQVQRE